MVKRKVFIGNSYIATEVEEEKMISNIKACKPSTSHKLISQSSINNHPSPNTEK